MLSRSVKAIAKNRALQQPLCVATFHHASVHYKKAAELRQSDDSPFDKLAQGINVFKSTILNAPPLRKITRPNIESLPFTGEATSWEDAIKEAQGLVNSADQERIFDPVKLVGKDLWELKGNVTKLLGSGHPFINTIGKHYLQGDTNRIRPLLVLLVAKATCEIPKTAQQSSNNNSSSSDDLSIPQFSSLQNPILPTQRRLAEISEMIYTSSLLHYDVIDHAEQITNPGFGNKMAVLAGDFLLARASLALAQLREPECIELMATCIANLVEGEFMQLQDPHEKNPDKEKAFDYYLQKVYMKTGSLIAQSCRASAVLAGCSSDISKIVYDYGRNLGIALQLFDDFRDFSKNAINTDKKRQNASWITAPVLLAWKEHAELGPLIERGFSVDGDTEKAQLMVYESSGLKKTYELANKHANMAIEAIEKLPPSEAQLALIQLARTLSSKKN